MFDAVCKWLAGAPARAEEPDALQVAIVVLLVQAAQMDDHFDETERATIERLLAARFALSAAAARTLVETAEQRAEASTQILPFTHLVVERLSAAERIQIIEMLYDVVYADGALDPDEDAWVRRIAGLIYVPDVERGSARKRVRERSGLPD